MAKVLVQYKQPADAGAFNHHYLTIHAPLVKALPGLRSFEISEGDIMAPGGHADVFMVAILTFDSASAIEAALASPAGQATVADLANFAAAGADILIFDTKSL